MDNFLEESKVIQMLMDVSESPKSIGESSDLPPVNGDKQKDYSDRRNRYAMAPRRPGATSFKGCNESVFYCDKKLKAGNFPETKEICRSNLRDTGDSSRKSLLDSIKSWWNHSVMARFSNYQDQGATAHDFQNSRLAKFDPNVKSIGNSLIRLGLPTVLRELDKNLQEVKKNKKSKESQEQFLKSVDKKLQKLSLRYHPDHASNLDSAGTHECQSALNAIRTVLKLLTDVFLENIFIDYKYEYFSRLDINVLVNEKELNNAIQAMLCKISELSEIKRMNIIGEIRKFLVECERCVESFFNCNKSDFEKYRKYALYHLQKNIEGYKKLEKECNLLNEECSEENNENMRAVVQSVLYESLINSSILRSLEIVAERSFKGDFRIFPFDKTMDEYYILPFVDYVNFLSMCNLLVEPRCSRFNFFVYGNPSFKDERTLFRQAYYLASSVYYNISCNVNAKKSLRENLENIFHVLQKQFRVDAYDEGKSNRAEMYEQLLALKEVMEDIQEKEKNFKEEISQYEKERKELCELFMNSRHDKDDSFQRGVTKRGNKSEEVSSKCDSLLEYGEEIGGEICHCKEQLLEILSTVEEAINMGTSEIADETEENYLHQAYL